MFYFTWTFCLWNMLDITFARVIGECIYGQRHSNGGSVSHGSGWHPVHPPTCCVSDAAPRSVRDGRRERVKARAHKASCDMPLRGDKIHGHEPQRVDPG